jgi:hypothetical protein
MSINRFSRASLSKSKPDTRAALIVRRQLGRSCFGGTLPYHTDLPTAFKDSNGSWDCQSGIP